MDLSMPGAVTSAEYEALPRGQDCTSPTSDAQLYAAGSLR